LLAQIDKRASDYPWSSQQFESGCDATRVSERILVLEDAGAIAGFVVYSTVLDEGSILNLAVDPARQRRGLATRLLVAAQEAMRGAGVRRCQLEVRQSNEGAISLYSEIGFVVDGARKNYYRSPGGREGALLMSKLL
jgi:[ribosomal protein S18]-alanine N-acetyltransferase